MSHVTYSMRSPSNVCTQPELGHITSSCDSSLTQDVITHQLLKSFDIKELQSRLII